MKLLFRKAGIPAVVAFIFLILIAGKCGSSYNCPNEPVIEIDPMHAQFSPVAKRLFIQLLNSDSCKEKGNVKLFVQYDASEFSKDSIAFLNAGTKVLLRDNGVFPDVTKGDGEYTGVALFDTALLRTKYQNAAAAVGTSLKKSPSQGTLVNFKGREAMNVVRITAASQVPQIDFAAFAAGSRVEVTSIFPSMEDIRNNCLYIIDLKVVEDSSRTMIPGNASSNPDGPWTFKKLMQGLANTTSTGISAEDFTMQWLEKWKNGETINGDPTGSRNMTTFINQWPKTGGGKLDLNQSPFRLMAIVNRLDLMPNPAFNSANFGGEIRFVFSIMNPQQPSSNLGSGDIIFEFGVNKTGKELNDYAAAWYALKDFAVGSPEYNSRLEAITNDIIAANDELSKPNGSNLDQLRTNEITFGGWQLREFVIDKTTHHLVGTTIKQEPADIFNTNSGEMAKLKAYADSLTPAIARNHYNIPEKLNDGTNFMGAQTLYPQGGIWGNTEPGKIINDQARFVLSLNTCSGCHLNEGRLSFLHNASTSFGTVTTLSAFIKGSDNTTSLGNNTQHSVTNDVRGIPRSFNDLARRAKVLWGFVNSDNALFGLQYDPVNMEH